jgi:tRNA-2-methylthio-N6-dimethylallyladenosine synthase
LDAVASIDGDFWLSFISPHPKDLSDDLISVMALHSDKIKRFVHHPLQSGSNTVLELMGRPYTREIYLEQIEKMRERLGDLRISTDIIVGFPGETEKDFMDTIDVVEKVEFDNAYIFIYSPRKYTRAASFPDTIGTEEKHVRFEFLRKRLIEISSKKNKKNIGKEILVLPTSFDKQGNLIGYSFRNDRVILNRSELRKFSATDLNSFVPVVVTDSTAANLHGKLLSNSEDESLETVLQN